MALGVDVFDVVAQVSMSDMSPQRLEMVRTVFFSPDPFVWDTEMALTRLQRPFRADHGPRGFKERLRDSSKQYQQNLDLRRRAQAMFAA